MLSLTSGDPDGHRQIKIESINARHQTTTKAKRDQVRSRIQSNRAQKGSAEANQRVVEAGNRPWNAPPTEGRQHSRYHEGNQLAAAFGAWVLCRRRQEEAQAEA